MAGGGNAKIIASRIDLAFCLIACHDAFLAEFFVTCPL